MNNHFGDLRSLCASRVSVGVGSGTIGFVGGLGLGVPWVVEACINNKMKIKRVMR